MHVYTYMYIPLFVRAYQSDTIDQGRRSRCDRCGGRRTNVRRPKKKKKKIKIFFITAGCPTLAISPQDCTRNDLRRSKTKIFMIL